MARMTGYALVNAGVPRPLHVRAELLGTHNLGPVTGRAGPGVEEEFAALVPVLRGFLARRVPPDDVDDLVQETVARVLARGPELTGEALAAYSVVTARNLVVSAAR